MARSALVTAAVVLVAACGPGEAPAVAPDTTADSADCPAIQRLATGGCCAAGQIPTAAGCAAVGVPGCAEPLAEPTACQPRWCGAATPCADGAVACPGAAAACTTGELATGAGCPAGALATPGGCRAAGTDATGSAHPFGTDPAAALPPALSPAAAPRWCLTADGRHGACAPGEAGCAVGTLVAADGTCAVWHCPGSFAPDLPAKGPLPLAPPCLPVADACGTDPFGGVPDGPGRVFVDPEAPAGGKGTRASPLASLAAALNAAPAGGEVVLAGGKHEAGLAVTKSVQIRGRCADLVRLAGPSGLPALRITGPGVQVALHDVTVTGGEPGVQVDGGARADLRRVQVTQPWALGLHVTGKSEADLEDVLVSQVQPRLADAAFGRGLSVQGASRLSLRRVRVDHCREAGLFASGAGTEVAARDLLVLVVEAEKASQALGRGISLTAGAHAVLDGVRVTGTADLGMLVSAAGTEAEVQDLEVWQPGIGPVSPSSRGVMVQEGARLTLRRAQLYRSIGAGLVAHGPQTRLRAEAVLVQATEPQPDGEFGNGLLAAAGAVVDLVDVRLSANHAAGLLAGHAGTRVRARDLVIDGTAASPADPGSGEGAMILAGARLDLAGGRLSANRSVGLVVAGPGSVAAAEDMLVDDTLPADEDGRRGRGVVVQAGGRLDLAGAWLVDNREAGVQVLDAQARLTGVRIARTLPRYFDNVSGAGAWLGGPTGQLELLACVLEANRSAGIAADQGAVTVLASVVIGTDFAPSLRRHERPGVVLGDGIALRSGAVCTVEDSVLAANRRAGLLAIGSQATLVRTVVTGSFYGLVEQEGSGVVASDSAVFGHTGQARVGDQGLFAPPPPDAVDVGSLPP